MRASKRWELGPVNERPRARRRVAVESCVESLEGRHLLSGLHALAEHPNGSDHGQADVSRMDRGDHAGEVRKAPNFYEFYIGPRRADLNVVAASVRLEGDRGLVFQGVMAGKIDTRPTTPADDSFYVFGVNRGSPNAVAPFFGRPGVVFDAVVVVSVTHDKGISAAVVDLTNGHRTTLPADDVRIEGRQVRVAVDPALLPTPAGGKPLSQYTFNLWPRSSLANPTTMPGQPPTSFVASFIPENAMAPIQARAGHNR